jgi:hypothetical protein
VEIEMVTRGQGDKGTGRQGSKPKFPKQRGQVLAWVALLLPLLLALVGLVFDGGLMWVQYRRARWAADGAAVAAASEIDPMAFLERGQVTLTADSLAVAQRYARENDPDLRLTSLSIAENVVYVDGWVSIEPVFLKMFGVEGFQVAVRGRERPGWGISQEGQ